MIYPTIDNYESRILEKTVCIVENVNLIRAYLWIDSYFILNCVSRVIQVCKSSWKMQDICFRLKQQLHSYCKSYEYYAFPQTSKTYVLVLAQGFYAEQG